MDKFISDLESKTQELISGLPTTIRPWSLSHDLGQDRGALITGPRGVGKTTFLLSQAKKHDRTLYFSADHPKANSVSLYTLGEEAFAKNYQHLIIDEVHFAKDWAQNVKALYDSFPKRKLWISDSSSIILRKGSHDLSRRTPRLKMPLLSFREYLIVKTGNMLPTFNPFRGPSPDGPWNDFSAEQLMSEFKNYLIVGTRPFFLEGRYAEKSLAIIEKTIFSDVPYFLQNIQSHHMSVMNSVMSYLSTSPVPTLNIDSLSREWAIGKPKVYELLSVMNELELINVVRKKTDHSSGKGAKIFLADPTWYHVLDGNTGSLREAFVATMFKGANVPLFTTENDVLADFSTPFGKIEIGGAKKGKKKADFVIRDDIHAITPSGAIPLWMVGCLY